MSSTQHQLIEQCAIRLRGIVEALDNIHDSTQHRSPHRWSTDLDDVHSSAESLLALINDQASPPCIDCKGTGFCNSISGEEIRCPCHATIQFADPAQAPVEQFEQAPPSEDQLTAAGLSYPLAKEDAVNLWYAGFRSEVVTVLEAWEAIGHDIGMNPSKGELLDSLRNIAAICNAHGNDMPAQSAIDQRQAIADAITGALAFGAQASRPPPADHWLRPFYDIGRAEGQRTQELAMLVRMLASSLKRHAPESNLVARATNYLAAKGLAGTPLRDAPASVEQVGGDERAAFEAAFAAMGRPVCRADYDQDAYGTPFDDGGWTGWQARAALAQPSPAQSEQHWPKLEKPAQVGAIRFRAGLSSRLVVEAAQRLYEFESTPEQEAERPEVVAYRTIGRHEKHQHPHYALNYYKQNAEDQATHWRERGCEVSEDELMTVSQHERIVGELRADRDSWAEQAEQRLADWDEMRKERDAALARVVELERQEPVATVAKVPGEDWNSLDFHRDLQDMQPGTKLYAAPVAQAQQLNDLDKQCRDDVARALGLRPNQERGFAWSYLLASIKSCVKASVDSAQAQHSVPDGYRLIRLEHFAAIKAQLDPKQVDAYRGRNIYDEDKVYANWNECRSALDEIKDVFQQIDWDAENELAELLAAAPGTEVPQAWLDVQAERRRQITAEGWTPGHDDEHDNGQMARAAACYALAGSSAPNDGTAALLVSLAWPWDEQWWKPSSARRDLVKACALALAEIERLDRAAATQGEPRDA
ncbi:TPA: hypothetical protein ACKP9X_002088 [Pseudomonas aeruginosa]